MADIDHLSRNRLPKFLDSSYLLDTSNQGDLNDLFELLLHPVGLDAHNLSDHTTLLHEVMKRVAKALGT